MGFTGLGMKNFVNAFICTCFFAFSHLFGAIIHAPNLNVIEKCLSDLNEDALVVFDVDYTLLLILPRNQGNTHGQRSVAC